jgi:hypothetical protein
VVVVSAKICGFGGGWQGKVRSVIIQKLVKSSGIDKTTHGSKNRSVRAAVRFFSGVPHPHLLGVCCPNIFPSFRLTLAERFPTVCLPRGGVAQLVRALPCHGRGYGFEPRRSRHFSSGMMFDCIPVFFPRHLSDCFWDVVNLVASNHCRFGLQDLISGFRKSGVWGDLPHRLRSRSGGFNEARDAVSTNEFLRRCQGRAGVASIGA